MIDFSVIWLALGTTCLGLDLHLSFHPINYGTLIFSLGGFLTEVRENIALVEENRGRLTLSDEQEVGGVMAEYVIRLFQIRFPCFQQGFSWFAAEITVEAPCESHVRS